MTRFQYYRVVEQGDVLHGPVSRIEAGSLAEAADPRRRADRRRWRVEAVR